MPENWRETLFVWDGIFSVDKPPKEGDPSPLKWSGTWVGVDNADATKRRLFWIACGTEDFLIDRNRSFSAQLNKNGVRHTYVETDGAHSWEVWRDYLPKFLQLVFHE